MIGKGILFKFRPVMQNKTHQRRETPQHRFRIRTTDPACRVKKDDTMDFNVSTNGPGPFGADPHQQSYPGRSGTKRRLISIRD
jgi:hypothetical protein